MERFVSRFTPSLMSPETLETMFVQRQALATTLVDRIRSSVVSTAKHHSLLVGPRGIGKTHLVSLVYHRVRAQADLQDRLRIAWLHEEEWGIDSFLDLLLRILRSLHEEYRDRDLAQQVEALYAIDSVEEARVRAADLLRDYIGDRTLLVIAENLDEVFKGLGDEGQKQFRAYLQEYPFTTLLATSQSLFAGVSRRTLPFYGFFRTHHLDAFSLDEAVELLANIARHDGKDDLVAFIVTAEGRARIRAVHHLAGGNPRVYVILSQFLTRESLDTLVEPFMLMLDDLTPYYQARMAWLSPQQRKIVEVLIENRAALQVKQIAGRCFITPQTASSQLGLLSKAGYVHSVSYGRESYYELREPLMRFSLEVKKQRAKPIRLFVDFLRIWYTRPELELQLDLLRPDAALDREYLLHALTETTEESDDPRVSACLRDYTGHREAGELPLALRVADELIEIRGEVTDWLRRFDCLVNMKRFDEALDSSGRALRYHPDHPVLILGKSASLANLGRVEEASAEATRACQIDPDMEVAWLVSGMLFELQNKHAEATTSFETAVRLNPEDMDAWSRLALAQTQAGLHAEALETIGQHIDRSPSPLDKSSEAVVQRARGFALIGTGLYHDGLAILNTIPLDSDQSTPIQTRRALAALMTSERRDGWELLMGKPEVKTSRGLAFAFYLASYGAWEDALQHLEESLGPGTQNHEHFGDEPDQWLGIAVGLTAAVLTEAWPKVMLERVHSLLDFGSRREKLPDLSIVLTSGLNHLPGLSLERVRAWRDAWAEAASEYDAFAPALRMLDTAVAYQESNDTRALLSLPIEERAILEQALGLSDSESEG